MDIEYNGYVVETGAEVDPMPLDEDGMCMHLFLSWRKFPAIGRMIGLAIAKHELGLEGEHADVFANEFTFQLLTAFLEKKGMIPLTDGFIEGNEISSEN